MAAVKQARWSAAAGELHGSAGTAAVSNVVSGLGGGAVRGGVTIIEPAAPGRTAPGGYGCVAAGGMGVTGAGVIGTGATPAPGACIGACGTIAGGVVGG